MNSSLYTINERREDSIVFRRTAEAAIDDAHQLDVAMKAQPIVCLSEDVLMENVLDAFLRQTELRDKRVIAAQRRLELQVHAGHHGIGALFMDLGEANTQTFQEEMSRVLCIM